VEGAQLVQEAEIEDLGRLDRDGEELGAFELGAEAVVDLARRIGRVQERLVGGLHLELGEL
jgi:hypothetical protein